jgi:nucleotide-binding universal stress UspA family protein
MFKRIVFPTDFSPSAQYALKYAVSLALDHEAKIILVHVVEDIDFNPPFTLASTPVIQAYHEEMENQVKKELANVISPEVTQQIEVEKMVVAGKPFVEIVRIAQERMADLIVISTHGKTGKIYSLLGSTAARVVSRTSCPVLVIRHPDVEVALQ